jgi:hypothetical protein
LLVKLERLESMEKQALKLVPGPRWHEDLVPDSTS